MTSSREGLEARFWSKVDRSRGPDACWLWLAARHSEGYGYFGSHGRMVRAHRLSYEMANGAIPAGLQVDHVCHTPPCVNPAHLRLATNAQNGANRKGASQNSRSGIRGVSPRGAKWQARVKLNGRAFERSYDTLWDADLAAILARASVFGHNAADRLILENADLLWGENQVPIPSRQGPGGHYV